MQIKGPQEANRFARQDGGLELFHFTNRDCCTTSHDRKSPHRLHHLNVNVPPLGTNLVVASQRINICILF